jgi:hypothetical protein
MQIATLILAAIGAAAATGTFVVAVHIAKDLGATTEKIRNDVDEIKGKAQHNAKVAKAAIAQMEL